MRCAYRNPSGAVTTKLFTFGNMLETGESWRGGGKCWEAWESLPYHGRFSAQAHQVQGQADYSLVSRDIHDVLFQAWDLVWVDGDLPHRMCLAYRLFCVCV